MTGAVDFGDRLAKLATVALIRPVKIGMEWSIRRFSQTGTRTFFDPQSFPWADELERNWQAIREELDAVLGDSAVVPKFTDLSPEQSEIARGTAWKSYFFYLCGERLDDNCARCPTTARELERIPGLESAFFSILEASTRLAPHRGPYSGVLRCHLALRVPSRTACGIRVGHEVAQWDEGKCLIFDDSHQHEAWNDSDGIRAVLFIDFERPLPRPLNWLNRATLALVARAAFVRELRANLKR